MTEKTVKHLEKCPICGTECPVVCWTKVDRVFESVDCLSCGKIHGRIIGPTYTGSWHYLGITEAHALKLSRRG
jgi:ferredoxin-like protein FixX